MPSMLLIFTVLYVPNGIEIMQARYAYVILLEIIQGVLQREVIMLMITSRQPCQFQRL